MDALIEHLQQCGIELPIAFTDHQLRILCEAVIRHCEASIEDMQWAEPGDLLAHYELITE